MQNRSEVTVVVSWLEGRLPPPRLLNAFPHLLRHLQQPGLVLLGLGLLPGVLHQLAERPGQQAVRVVSFGFLCRGWRWWRLRTSISSITVLMLLPGGVLLLPLLPGGVLTPVLTVLLVVLSVVALLPLVRSARLASTSDHLAGYVLHQVLGNLHLRLRVFGFLNCQGYLGRAVIRQHTVGLYVFHLSHLQRFASKTANTHHAGECSLLFSLVAESDETKALAEATVVQHH